MKVDAYSSGTGVRAHAGDREPTWAPSQSPRWPSVTDLIPPPPLFRASLDWWSGRIPTTSSLCALCALRGAAAPFDGQSLLHFVVNYTTFDVVRCPRCRLMRLDRQPHPVFLDVLYRTHYHGATPAHPLYEQGCHNLALDPDKEQRKADLALATIRRYRDPARGKLPHYLEVGYGAGYLLRAAYDGGFIVRGYEKTVLHSSLIGPPMILRTEDFASVDHWQVDVVAMMSVLEHVPDPVAYLRAARRNLRPGGVLVLRVPDTSDAGPRLALFEHLWHFNQATITQLLEAVGFRVLEIGGFGQWHSRRSDASLTSMTIVARSTAVVNTDD